jgi:uncharacterized protein
LTRPSGRKSSTHGDHFSLNARLKAGHGVAFPQAVKAFRDPFGVEWIDEREDYGEERINLLGLCDGMILPVTYTGRGEHIRLISARPGGKT